MIFLYFFQLFFFLSLHIMGSVMRYYVLSVSKNRCRVLESSCDFRKSLRFINTKLLRQDESLELVSDCFVKYLLDDANINFDWSDCKAD